MEHKCVFAVAVLSGVMAVVIGTIGVLGGLVTLGLAGEAEPAHSGSFEVWAGLAFVLICLLGMCAGSALKRQTNQIADLRRQLTDVLTGSR